MGNLSCLVVTLSSGLVVSLMDIPSITELLINPHVTVVSSQNHVAFESTPMLQESDALNWVWLKIQELGLRGFSLFPLAKGAVWVHVFEPQPTVSVAKGLAAPRFACHGGLQPQTLELLSTCPSGNAWHLCGCLVLFFKHVETSWCPLDSNKHGYLKKEHSHVAVGQK